MNAVICGFVVIDRRRRRSVDRQHTPSSQDISHPLRQHKLMRRRRHQLDENLNGSSSSSTRSFSQTVNRHLRKLDMYPKLEEDYKIKTSSGATMSIVMGVAMTILAVSETWHYAHPKLVDLVEVDGTIHERMKVELNMTFFELPCSKVDLVAMDVAGEHQIHADASYRMHKTRLTIDGRPIGEKISAKINDVDAADDVNVPVVEPLPDDYCGSCFGARDGCCNTCEELKAAYLSKGWSAEPISGDKSEQCKRDRLLHPHDGKNGDDVNEGCMLEGSMTVNKVAGNFHVALGRTRSVNGRLVHAFNAKDMNHFNTSHRIDHVSFGPSFPSQTNPLNGQIRLVDFHNADTGVFQYFIKIVPTQFANAYVGSSYRSSQYSFTEKFVPIGDGHEDDDDDPDHTRKHAHKHPSVIRSLPGVFFIYDISPFQIRRTMESESFFEYLARLFAIVGGVCTISSIADSAISKLRRTEKSHLFI